MGLDMYLYARDYQSKANYKDKKKGIEGFYPDALKRLGNKIFKDNFMSKQTRYQIGYWRKFNALQGYFEKKVEHENELLHGIYVDWDTMEELIKIMIKVKKELKKCPTKQVKVVVGWKNGEKIYKDMTVYDCELAQELLPPETGFFYGSEYIDEYYVECLDYSLKLFRKALKLSKEHDYDIIYEANW